MGHRSKLEIMFNPLSVYNSEEPFRQSALIIPSSPKIHGHRHVSKLQTRKWTGEFRTQERGIMDIMDQPKNQRHQLEQRSPEIDRHSLIHPVSMHLVRGKCLLGSTLRECARIRQDPGCKMRSPLLSGHTFCRQTWSSPISPRCGLLLRQAWVEKQGEEEVEEEKRRGGGDDPQQTELMELEWEHKCWPKVQWKKGKREGRKGSQMKAHECSPTLLHSSSAESERGSTFWASKLLCTSVTSLWCEHVNIWWKSVVSWPPIFASQRTTNETLPHTHKENTLCGSFILAIHPPFVCVSSCFFADSEKLGGLSVGVMGVSSLVWSDAARFVWMRSILFTETLINKRELGT